MAPRDLYEREIAYIWQELLGVAQVGAEDNFYELGGHSLLATQVASRLRDTFRAELPLQPLLAAATLAQLAEVLRGALGGDEPAAGGRPLETRRIPRRDVGVGPADRAPLSFAQERMWYLDQLDPGTPIYNLFNFVEVTGPLAIPVLSRCLDEVVRRHEGLRTVFAAEGGKPLQRILPPAPFPFPVVDLSRLAPDVRRAEMARLEAADHNRSFDLARGPLFRATLLVAGPREHVALFNMHHIFGDGWSWVVLVREIAALYTAFAAGNPSPLPELPLQYADFAVWQRGWLAGEGMGAELGYWRGRLEGAPPPLELPADRPRSSVHGFVGGGCSRLLPAALAADLKALADREGVTLFMVLLAGFLTLLYRYTGEEDLVVGVPIANRTRQEIEGLIGFFLNTLVLRTPLEPELGFAGLLARVREVASGAYAHQDLPLEAVLQAMQPDRSVGHAPPFSVMFQVQNLPEPQLDFAGLSLKASRADLRSALDTAIFDLCLVMEPGEEGIAAWVAYNSQLFAAATIERLLARLEVLLAGAVAAPQMRLDELPLASEAERSEVLAWGRGTAAQAAEPLLVHQAFARQAAATPEAVALVVADTLAGTHEKLTYAELDRRANRLAHHLRGLGVGPEVLVAVCLERSAEMIVALLAVLKAGGAYVPIDPGYPRERLDYLLTDTAAPVLITAERRLAAFGAAALAGVRAVCLDTDAAAIAAQPDEAPEDLATPAALAYLIYTSGSTGEPKGVMVRHSSLVGFTAAARAEFGIGAADRVLQFASTSFDTSVEEIYPCLTAGGTLVLRDDAMLRSTADFLAACGSLGITLLDLPTAYWHGLAADLADAGSEVEWPAALTRVIVGGERVLPERAAAWRRRLGDRARLWNTYGPTESTVTATLFDASAASSAGGGDVLHEVPIGRPIAGTRAVVLDPRLEPVPAGVPGELCLGGSGVARGYLGRPALTAARFVPDPFVKAPEDAGARLYRTGDLVRWLPTGELEFLGRTDRQVKIRGFRVELGEIEAALAAHPAVREAAVLAREDGPGERRLVAYIAILQEQEAAGRRTSTRLPQGAPAGAHAPRGVRDPGGLAAQFERQDRPPRPAGARRRAAGARRRLRRTLHAGGGGGGGDLVRGAGARPRGGRRRLLRARRPLPPAAAGDAPAEARFRGRRPPALPGRGDHRRRPRPDGRGADDRADPARARPRGGRLRRGLRSPDPTLHPPFAEPAGRLPPAVAPFTRHFEAQAAHRPEATALVFGDERLTYRELNARANRLARRLRLSGVGRDTIVGLCLDRSLDLVVALRWPCVLKAEVVPSCRSRSVAYPEERLAFLLADSRALVLLAERRLAAGLAAGGRELLVPAELRQSLARESAADLPGEPAADSLAYVIYTSGSTGRPKGVLVEHRNLAYVLAAGRELGFTAEDVMPVLAPSAFDIFLFELLSPLAAGGTAVLVRLDPVPDLARLSRLLTGVTRLHAVPALMRQIVDRVRAEGEEPRPYRGLRTLFTGGDTVPAGLLADLLDTFPHAELRVLYGPTEGTIIASSHRVPRGERPVRSLIGTALPGAALRLCDAGGRPVADGETGEIHIGGAGVARGYLNRAELTAERFRRIDGDRWYRSGDLARRLADGNLEFLGRADGQVKVRGFRIETGEVESVLAEHPGVREAVVGVREDGSERKHLVAYVVPAEESAAPGSELRAFLGSRLPEHMIPAFFLEIPAFP